MGVVRQAPIAVNGSGGALTPILASTFARYVELLEDGATPQGLTILWPNGTTTNHPPSQEPIVVAGNKGGALGGPIGPCVGVPAGGMVPALPKPGGGTIPQSPATQYCQVKSLTATATAVHVDEYN